MARFAVVALLLVASLLACYRVPVDFAVRSESSQKADNVRPREGLRHNVSQQHCLESPKLCTPSLSVPQSCRYTLKTYILGTAEFAATQEKYVQSLKSVETCVDVYLYKYDNSAVPVDCPYFDFRD